MDDSRCYPGFLTPFWGKTLLALAAVAAVTNFLPEADDRARFTQWIYSITPASDYWQTLNLTHTLITINAAEDAKDKSRVPPPQYKYRSPQ